MSHCSNTTLEQTVRKDFRSRWRGWLESYQPGLGGGTGIPDVQIMAQPPVIVPIEMKRGFIIDTSIEYRVMMDELRPDQFSWHTRFAAACGIAWFYIGVMDNGTMRRFLVPASIALMGRKIGIVVGSAFLHEVDVNPNKRDLDITFTQSVIRIISGNN